MTNISYTIFRLFLIMILGALSACTGDNNWVPLSECSKVETTFFESSIFDHTKYPKLHNEYMSYKNDGSGKVPGSFFMESIALENPDDTLVFGGLINSQDSLHCISAGVLSYYEGQGLVPFGVLEVDNCQMKKISGNTYQFTGEFKTTLNPGNQKYGDYVRDHGVIQFTCESK